MNLIVRPLALLLQPRLCLQPSMLVPPRAVTSSLCSCWPAADVHVGCSSAGVPQSRVVVVEMTSTAGGMRPAAHGLLLFSHTDCEAFNFLHGNWR